GSDQKAMWGAQDALVLKWVALQVAPMLPLHERCEHIKGHGGGPASVRKMSAALTQNGYRWVLRTDVKGYYANIDKTQLLNQVYRHIPHTVLRDLINQYVHYTVENGGVSHTPEKGIGRGCSLSPLMGALYLHEIDEHFGREMQTDRLYYARYMDDIVVLTHSRWQLRKHVRKLNQLLAEKQLRQHPGKTFIGRTLRGFDWMGAMLESQGVTDVAPRAKANHREKVRRLYERAWRWREPKGVTRRRLSTYRWRWAIWAGAIVPAVAIYQTALAANVMMSGEAGVIGYTSTMSVSLPGKSPVQTPSDTDAFCISKYADSCSSKNDLYADDWGQPLGFQIWRKGGTRVHAWAVPVGEIRYEYQAYAFLTDVITGHVSMSLEGTTNTWVQSNPHDEPISPLLPPPINDHHNASGVGPHKLVISSYHIKDTTGLLYQAGQNYSGNANVKFAIIAGKRGLSPGTYTIPSLYFVKCIAGSCESKGVLSPADNEFTVANYGCDVAAPGTLDLSDTDRTATMEVTANCQDMMGGNIGEAGAYVSLEPGPGVSVTDATASGLGVPGAPGLSIRGNWSTVPPDCTGDQTVFFDGRYGPRIFDLLPGTGGQGGTDVAFRLCGTAAPGLYTTRALIRIVTK
ncbi:reverse transcriptase domain-containing protein, partial [Providencia alcalifaciens]|uniref:reverse transcriptase domain-containing protein n=1 Tax=Providencia alcalifaciens TaxID=126385 RepID=UPI002B0622F4